MLRRLSRPLSALFALWFALVLVDPGVLHACAMHGSGHAPAAAASDVTADHGAHHDAAPEKDAATQCSCVGQCSVAPAVAPLPDVATFAVPTRVAQAAALFAEPADLVASSPDVSLPFANGPPQA
jgi:hypothetical protein